MKLTQLKQLIKEEVAYTKLEIITEDIQLIDSTHSRKCKLHETLLASLLNLFVEPKLRKQAEYLKNSGEYKELQQQIKVSAQALNNLTDQLKKKVSDYEKLIKELQKDGIDVKMGDDITKVMQKTRDRHKDILKKYKVI